MYEKLDKLRAELGKAKLLASGHSEGYINSMPNSTLEKIADSENGYQTKSYLTEVLTDSGIELVETTASVFESSLLSARTFDPNTITIVDEDGNVLHEGENTVLPTDVTVNVNGGTVMILTSFYSVEDANQPSHFLMVSEFLWTSMPDYRGTDFLGNCRHLDCGRRSKNCSCWTFQGSHKDVPTVPLFSRSAKDLGHQRAKRICCCMTHELLNQTFGKVFR